MSKRNEGLILAFLTFFLWGVFPVYFKFIDGVGAAQVLAHRIVWSFALLFGFLWFSDKLSNVRRLLRVRKVALNLLLTGCLISSNWGIFIYAVNEGRILETSLGYFINPLFSILLGAIFLRERLSINAKIAALIVAVAIGVQIYALGELPLISLVLPASFALYGLVRKKVSVPSFEGLFIETSLVLPFALAYLVYVCVSGANAFKFDLNGALLFFSGFVTIAPLLLFTAAARRLPLSTVGFMQYLSPSISMLIAVFIYGESLDFYKLLSFILIWASLALAGLGSIRKKK